MCVSYKGRGISGGKLKIEVSYFGWHVHSETHDLCTETTCPVETGDFLVAHSQVLPAYTPSVSFSYFFKQLHNMTSLNESSERCILLSEIWYSFEGPVKLVNDTFCYLIYLPGFVLAADEDA